MIHQVHIVVADQADGKVVGLFVGDDMAAANEVFEKAGPEHEAVRIFDFPQPTRLRYPAQEVVEIKQRAAHAERNSNAALSAKRAAYLKASDEAKEHAKRLKVLAAELKALEIN